MQRSTKTAIGHLFTQGQDVKLWQACSLGWAAEDSAFLCYVFISF